MDVMSRASCVTKMRPPLKWEIASVRASTDSMSRWFVGSSRTMMWGFMSISAAKATRAFWPPERLPILVKCEEPGRPNCPRYRRGSSAERLKADWRYSTPVFSRGSSSSKCWWYWRTRMPLETETSPSQGSSCCIMMFRSVVLPAPLGPTMAMREPQSTPISTSERSHGSLPS
mmetsp:Transcript_71354/g.231099  ORF Transcript_71354/g.231099 Transcript_71354/m.231099 type:complete len:173 (+) Transcript_71354:2018-2536(+)